MHGQVGSATLVLGAVDQFHNHPDSSGVAVSVLTGWGEASYVVYPWLIPALRIEATQVDGSQDPNFAYLVPVLTRFLPAVNFVIRPNVVVQLVGEIDHANGAPPGGWAGAGGLIAFPLQTNAAAVTGTEFETITANLKWAF